MIIKYFLSKTGAKTNRLAGVPGAGHYDLAKATLADLGQPVSPDTDVYAKMARFGYARVVELPEEGRLLVDAPRPLSRAQREAIQLIQAREGYKVELNSQAFIESRQLAASLVNSILS